MKERQELWCHECQRYVQFDIDISLNGNHVIICPVCGHEHCRVVENGKITEVRWDSRNNSIVGNFGTSTYLITTGNTTTLTSTYNTYLNNTNLGTGDSSTVFNYNAWMNFGTGNGYI